MALPVAALIAVGTSMPEPALAVPILYNNWQGTSPDWSDDNNWSGPAPYDKQSLEIRIDQDSIFPVINKQDAHSGSGDLIVGNKSAGRLDITNSGGLTSVVLTSKNATIGANKSGEVNVTGHGATWRLSDALLVGDAGKGQLTVADDGKVSVGDGKGTIELGHQPGGSGSLYIGGSGGTAESPGKVDAHALAFGDGKGELIFNHTADDYRFDLAISSAATGTATISNHHGVTRLTADNSAFTGTTRIDGGTVIVDDILGGTMAVGSNGTLRGTGAVGALTLDGVLAPGNSVGTMTVDGNVTVNSGAIYRVHVNRTGASRTNVEGKATINGGTVDVVSLETDGDDSVVGTHRILQAESRSGEFDRVEANYAFLQPRLTYDATGVSLILSVGAPESSQPLLGTLASPFSSNPNQDALVTILNSLDQSDSRYNAFVDRFLGLGNDEVAAVLEELSGSRSAGVSGISTSLSTALTDFIQMANGFGGGSGGGFGQGALTAAVLTPGTIQFASTDPTARNEREMVAQLPSSAGVAQMEGPASLVRVVGQTGRQGSAGGRPGSDSRSAGLHAGIDMPATDDIAVGAAIGYEQGRTTSGDMLGIDTESYSGAVYGRYRLDDLRLSGAFSYSRIQYDSTRTIPRFGRQSAEYSAQAWNLDAQAAYDLRPGPDGLTFSPLVGVRHIGMRQDSYQETGTAGLSVDRLESDSTRLRLGTEIRYDTAMADDMNDDMTVALTARASWSREIGAPETAVLASLLGSDTFAVQGQGLPRDIAELGVVLDIGISENAALFAAYDGRIGDNFADHRGQAGLRFAW